jgi:hypothetical protein
MQWISFESIAKCSRVNEIVKRTNLKDRLLLSEGRRVEVVPLPRYFILPPHFFVPLPQTHLKHFDLDRSSEQRGMKLLPPMLCDDDAAFWAPTFRELIMPFSMEFLQHVLQKNISQYYKDKGLEWNH